MLNSPLLLNYLCFGAHFLQVLRLTTKVFILAFWLRCMLLPWQRDWLKTRLKKWFLLIKEKAVVRFFSSFAHYDLKLNPLCQPCFHKILTQAIFVIRRKSFSALLKIPFVKIPIFRDRSFTRFLNYFFAKYLEILTTGSLVTGKFLQKHSLSIFRATAHALHLTGIVR